MLKKGRRKMEKSPFLVDLLAETQRIDEETRVKQQEEIRKQRMLERTKNKVKQEIIVKVLSEVAEMDAVRNARRTLLDDAKRQKARRSIDVANKRQQGESLMQSRSERDAEYDKILNNRLEELMQQHGDMALEIRQARIKEALLSEQTASLPQALETASPTV